MINIKGDVREFQRQLDSIQRKVIPVAVPRAMNDTVKQINTQVRRQMADDLGIQQKHFKRRLKVYRASRKNWEAKNWVGTKILIPVSAVFKSGRKGIAYAKARGLVDANSLFEATMPTGHSGIFRRKGQSRLPIQEVSIDLSDAAIKAVSKWGPKIVRERFRRILAGKLTELLRRQR